MPELVPMLGKVSTSLDHVNEELDKVGTHHRLGTDATAKVDSHGARGVGSDLQACQATAGFSARPQARPRRRSRTSAISAGVVV